MPEIEVKSYTNKQANVLYHAAKEGFIRVSQGVIATLYENVDSITCYSTHDYGEVKEAVACVRKAVTAIFIGDYMCAQRCIDDYTLIMCPSQVMDFNGKQRTGENNGKRT